MIDGSRDFWGGPIPTYSRVQILADGVLVDATETTQEAGFAVPVTLAAAISTDVRDIPAA